MTPDTQLTLTLRSRTHQPTHLVSYVLYDMSRKLIIMGTARVLEKEGKECSLHALVKKKKKKRKEERVREREREGSLMTLLFCETLLWLRISFLGHNRMCSQYERTVQRERWGWEVGVLERNPGGEGGGGRLDVTLWDMRTPPGQQTVTTPLHFRCVFFHAGECMCVCGGGGGGGGGEKGGEGLVGGQFCGDQLQSRQTQPTC